MTEILTLLQNVHPDNNEQNKNISESIQQIFDDPKTSRRLLDQVANSSLVLALSKVILSKQVLNYLRDAPVEGTNFEVPQQNIPDGRNVLVALYHVALGKSDANEELSRVLAKFLVDFAALKQQVDHKNFNRKVDFEVSRLGLIW